MRRSLPAIAVLATLVLLSGCTGALGSGDTGSAAQAQLPAEQTNRTVDVSASGSISAQPNQAVVRVGVEARADDAATARQRLAANVTELRSALQEIEGARVTTSGYDIGQDYRRPGPEGEQPEPEYVARQRFQITINDTEQAGTIIDTAVANGATSVDDVRFTLSADRRDELEEQALEAAMDRARVKAETLAGSADLTIDSARKITTVERGYNPYELQATATASADGAETTIDTGAVTVAAQVHVTYDAQEE